MPSFFNYNNNIPAANNNPSVDQPDMETNTNSIDSIINVDHYSFRTGSDGTHKQVQLANTPGGNGTLPVGLQGVGFETLFSSANSVSLTGELYFVRGAGAALQMTGPGVPSALTNGSTFLPGGLLLQWGTAVVNFTGATTTINFPTAFLTNVFNVQITCISIGNVTPNTNNVYIYLPIPPTLTNFTVSNTAAGNIASIYWMAIGN